MGGGKEIAFGVAASGAATACEATRAALTQALAALDGASPKLAIVFASDTYADFEALVEVLDEMVPGVPRIGGSAAGAVYGPSGVHSRGVSVALIGGTGVEAATETVPIVTWDMVDAVPAAARLAARADEAASRGLGEFLCIAFAPSLVVDGEALTAAVRKGAGARAQLAGGTSGDDFKFERASVLADRQFLDAGLVLAGVFTSKPVGVAARHGGKAIGPIHAVTHSDGPILHALDGRPAMDVWLEDARTTGIVLPTDRKDLAVALASDLPIGVQDPRAWSGADAPAELVVRVPFEVLPDGSVRLSATIPDGSLVCVVRLTPEEMRRAAEEAARVAREAVGGESSGALLLGCAGRLAILGDGFADEVASIGQTLGAPVGGACVSGEIARARKDVAAFFNTTQVVVAFPK